MTTYQVKDESVDTFVRGRVELVDCGGHVGGECYMYLLHNQFTDKWRVSRFSYPLPGDTSAVLWYSQFDDALGAAYDQVDSIHAERVHAEARQAAYDQLQEAVAREAGETRDEWTERVYGNC